MVFGIIFEYNNYLGQVKKGDSCEFLATLLLEWSQFPASLIHLQYKLHANSINSFLVIRNTDKHSVKMLFFLHLVVF